MRIQSLLTDIRAELADPEKERWSDQRLLNLLSQAQVEVALETRVIVARTSIAVIANQSEYFIGEDVEVVLRAFNELGPIELVSHFEMDECNPNWETVVGTRIEKLVYDLLTPNRLRVYPTPQLAEGTEVYTFEAGNSNPLIGGEMLGVVTSIDNYSFNSPFGAVTGLLQPGINESFSSPFGVVTGISESSGSITIQYTTRPATLTSVDSVMELSESFRKALLHLVCANALTADIDAKADALSSKHYQLYQVQLARLKNNKAHNQVKGNNARLIRRDPYAS